MKLKLITLVVLAFVVCATALVTLTATVDVATALPPQQAPNREHADPVAHIAGTTQGDYVQGCHAAGYSARDCATIEIPGFGVPSREFVPSTAHQLHGPV